MESPEAHVLAYCLVRLVVELNVASLGIAHGTLDGEVLHVGVVRTALQTEHVALADTLGDVSAVRLILVGHLVRDDGLRHVLTDDGHVRSVQICSRVGKLGVFLVVHLANLLVAGVVAFQYVVALLDEDAVALSLVGTLCSGCKGFDEGSVGRNDEVVHCLCHYRTGLGFECYAYRLGELVVREVADAVGRQCECVLRVILQCLVFKRNGLARYGRREILSVEGGSGIFAGNLHFLVEGEDDVAVGRYILGIVCRNCLHEYWSLAVVNDLGCSGDVDVGDTDTVVV